MIRIYTDADQLTPRAGPNENQNPFDSTTPTNLGPSHHNQSFHHHHLLSPNSYFLPTLSPTRAMSPNSPVALPTTHLSIDPPVFNIQQPPPSSLQRALAKSQSQLPQSQSAVPPPPPPPPLSSSKGQIHVKLIQARALNVRSVHALPYVVVQFEQSEFISRNPINEFDKEVRGTATNFSRNSSSLALSAIGAIGSKAALSTAIRGKNSGASTPSSTSSNKPSPTATSSPATSIPSLFGSLSAHNPVWKHEVSLFVLKPVLLHTPSY
jgi:hypothetical protein